MKIFGILLLCLHWSHSKEVLRHVHAIFRHGDRAPTNLFSDDVSKLTMWPLGWGQLTEIGMRQHFALGKWLRVRYGQLLSQAYRHQEITVRSTDVDRTLMSAQSNLAGLYYDDRVDIAPNLYWRPVPVHTVPQISDTLNKPKKCNKYKEAVHKMYKTRHYRSLFSEYQGALDVMRRVSKNRDLKFEESWYIYDSLFCERAHNVTLDPWVTEQLYVNISKIYDLSWKMMYHGEELARLSGGRFLDEMVNEMTTFARNSHLRKDKFQMISGHDTDLGALLSAIGIYDGVRPPYAACLMLELVHRPSNNANLLKNWIVKVYYKTEEGDSPTNLAERRLKGCRSAPCTLADFIDFVRPRTINAESYQKLCDSSSSERASRSGLPVYGLLVTVLLFIGTL